MPRALPLLLLLAIPVGGLLVPRPPTAARVATMSAQERVRATYLRDLDTLEAAIARLTGAANAHRDQAAQRAFRQTRAAYKRIEYRVAYEMPEAEVEINGPPLPRVNEYASDGVLPPAGLQVIEAALFPEPAAEGDSVVAAQIKLMRPTLARLRKQRASGVDRDAWLFDALRQELARVSTLGLAGFDATISGDGIRESAEALRGVREAAAGYEPDADPTARTRWAELDRRLGAAIAELERNPDFDRFDRLGFLVRHAAPIARALTDYQSALGVARIQRPHAWSGETNTIFDAGAIDPLYYAPSDLSHDPRAVALGRRLFFSTALSAGGTRACATCHQPGRAFTDGRRLARTDPGPGRVRNTPTLLNASVQPFQFADQRARSLEDQVAVVMANPREMNQPIGAAVARLRQDTAVAMEFAAAFGETGSGAVTERRLQLSIAAFVRSLPGFASRFDRAVQGDTTALTTSERRGFDLFMGKAACATCHFPPVFGGALPPTLLESEPEVIGVPSRPDTGGATIDPDPGVAGFDHATVHRHAFKTPSLRNVELTAPYMHNGVYRTLEDVVDFYDRGGGAGIGIELSNQTLSPEPLRLTAREKRDLIAFLGALTDTAQVAGNRRH
jgi:cytochrome c peroxidase